MRPPGVSVRSTEPVEMVAPAGAAVAVFLAAWDLARGVWSALGPTTDGFSAMVPASAVCVTIVAVALLLVRARGAARPVGRVLAAAALILGVLMLGQYAFDWSVGELKRNLFGEEWWATRPSPLTVLGVVLLAGAILAICGRRERVRRAVDPLGTAGLLVALTGLVARGYSADVLVGLDPWEGTSISGAVALGSLAIGVLFADPSRGFAALFLDEGAGGRLLRRLLPAAFLAPLLLGGVALFLSVNDWVDGALAAAMLIVSLIALQTAWIVRQAAVLDAADAERNELLAKARAAREEVTAILERITDGFYAVDREGAIRYVNREAERLLQRPRAELLGRSLWEEIPEGVGRASRGEYERAMAEQQPVRFETYSPSLGAWFDVHAFPGPDGLSVHFRDITHRKRDEQRLRESEARFRLLADMVPQHVWTTDPDGHHNYFSRRWYAYTGMRPGEVTDEGWWSLVHPEDRPRAMLRWQHSLRTGEPYASEYRVRGADGRYAWFLALAMPLRNEDGELVQWFGTLTDITVSKRLAEERERLLEREQAARADAERRREELERVTESRARLIRGFSHDVKNPLHAAHVTAEMLERGRIDGELSESQREGVHRIRRSVRTALRLMDDLLGLAQAESGQLTLEHVPTDVGRIAREVTDEYRAPALDRGPTLELHAPEGLLAETDPSRVRQILANLLSNTMKYAPEGTVRVEARLRESGGPGPGPWIAVSVIDRGRGIPRELQEEIFREYTRLDTTGQTGAGIGLAISRRMARLLGGDLTVDSDAGRGATFTLWVPPARNVVGGGEVTA